MATSWMACAAPPSTTDAGDASHDVAVIDAVDQTSADSGSDAVDTTSADTPTADSPCASGQTECAGRCVDTLTDPSNCGHCANLCAGNTTCQSGTCACATGTILCSGTCVNTQSDNANCGGCGISCPAGMVCNAGACGTSCTAPRIACTAGGSTTCVDPTSDPSNCGVCGNLCAGGTSCVAGACACTAGQMLCSGTCVQTATDPNNCGACGNTCGTGTSCVAGVCQCPTGRTACSGSCVDLTTDANHCGSCTNVCAGGTTCTAGACACPAGLTACSGVCVDTRTSTSNCGSCGSVCAGTCSAGTCTTSGAGGAFSVVRVGDGVIALSAAASPVVVERRLITDGSLVSSVSLPIASVGSMNAFTLGGLASSEGGMTRSTDGHYLVVPGYAAIPGTASVATTPGIPRVVARISAAGVVDTSTTLLTAFSNGNVRGAATVDGSAFWVSGTATAAGAGGLHYVPFGTNVDTSVMPTPSNIRWVSLFNGQIYAASGANNLFTVGTGMPTTGPQTATTLPGLPFGGSESPYGFVLFDRNAGVPGLDTLYLADDRTIALGGGIQKWTFNGTTWTLVTTFNSDATTHFRGIVARVLSTGGVEILAVTAEGSANRVVQFVDDGTGAAPAYRTVSTAPMNTAYRGITFAPM